MKRLSLFVLVLGFFAQPLAAAPVGQPAAAPATLAEAARQGMMMGCLLNISGNLPFDEAHKDVLAKANIVPVPEPEWSRQVAPLNVTHQTATVLGYEKELLLISYPDVRMCRVMIFNAPADPARRTISAELQAQGSPWKRAGITDNPSINVENYKWDMNKDTHLATMMSWPKQPTTGTTGLQLMVSVAQVKAE